jgi:hypothetical protein
VSGPFFVSYEKWKKTVRVSVGFTEAQWSLVDRAVRQRYLMHAADSLRPQEVGSFINKCVFCMCRAVLQSGFELAPAACDVRWETEAEHNERMELDERFAAGVPICVAIPGAKPPRIPKEAAEVTVTPNVITLEWMREHFPKRWGSV